MNSREYKRTGKDMQEGLWRGEGREMMQIQYAYKIFKKIKMEKQINFNNKNK